MQVTYVTAGAVQPGFTELNRIIDAHSIVSMTDASGTITYVNDHFCAISGYDRAELLGANHRLLKSDAHPPAFYAELWSTLRGGRTWSGVIQNRRKDGLPYWVQSTIMPLSSVDARYSGYISIRTDITARERVRLALALIALPGEGPAQRARKAEALALACGASAAGILEFDEDGHGWQPLCGWPAPPSAIACTSLHAAAVGNASFTAGKALAVAADMGADEGEGPTPVQLLPLYSDAGVAFGACYLVRRDAKANDEVVNAVLAMICDRTLDRLEAERRTARRAEEQAWVDFVVRGAGAGVWDWDIATNAMQINDRYATMLGFERGDFELTLDGWREMTHPEDRDGALRAVQQHLSGFAPSYSHEFRLRKKDGEWLWVQTRGMITARGPDGAPLRMSGIHLDISAERDAQSALVAEQQRLALIINHLPIGLWEMDTVADTVHISPTWAEKLGYDSARAPKTRLDWDELIHPDDRDEVQATAGLCIAGAVSSYTVEFRMADAAGDWRTVLSRAIGTERDESGRARKLVGIRIDITQQKRAEQLLATSKARLRAVLDNAPMGIVSADPDGRLAFVNGWVIDHFGWSPESLYGDAWLEHVHPVQRSAVASAWRRFVAGEAADYDQEFSVVLDDGSERVLHARAVKVLAGHVHVGFSGVFEDVTRARAHEAAQQSMQQQLQHAHKMEAVGKLAGGIAHDFNNLLAVILGYSSLARQHLTSLASPKLDGYLETILNAAERGRVLIEKLLAFSRGNQSANQVVMDCRQAVADVTDMLRPLIPSSVELSATLGDAPELIRIDVSDLNQVLLNLIVNARDAIATHGTIAVTVEHRRVAAFHCASCHAPVEGDYICIEIADDGCGLADGTAMAMFDPFFTTKELGKGTGLGLSVVHGIVHEAGGHLCVASTLGVETRISVYLPVVTDNGPKLANGAPGENYATAANSIRVLVADDEPGLRTYFKELLTNEGMQVILAADGRIALEIFSADPDAVDVIISDQTMPGLTGMEWIAYARERRPKIPAVLTSGYSDEASAMRAAECGLKFLRKPADGADIVSTIYAALSAATT